MDLTAVAGAIGSIKTAGDMVKTFVNLKNDAEINKHVVELQGVILDAQSKMFEANQTQLELAQRVKALEEELASIAQWGEEKQRYSLFTPSEGQLFYALKQSASNGEPAHYLCVHCYGQNRKSLMMQGRSGDGWTVWKCAYPNCRYECRTGYRGSSATNYATE